MMARPPARFLATLLLALLGAPAVAGCAALGFAGDEGPGAPRTAGDGGSGADGRVAVAAAFYPLAWVAERVGGDRVEVTQLTQPGAEPHDLELTVGETADVARADLVLLQAGFQPAIDDAVEQGTRGTVLDAADVVRQRSRAGSEPDPHFWLDPREMARLAEAVAEALGGLDGEHADAYADRARALTRELSALDDAYAAGLADCERDVVVVNHDAFGYLSRYGLEFEAITGLSPDAEPTAGDLARLGDLAREEGVTTVFSERLASPRTARALADDLGVRTGVLDPIEGLSSETADEDYLSLMRGNLEALKRGQGC